MTSSLIAATLLGLAGPASAATFMGSDPTDQTKCRTYGDPNIYGKGVRAGFYLAWLASLFSLNLASSQYSGSRVACVAVLWAILISSINSTIDINTEFADDKRLIIPTFEWTIVFYLTIGLFGANIPAGKAQMNRATGAWVASSFATCVALGACFHLYWTSLHELGDRDPDEQHRNYQNLLDVDCAASVAFLAPFNAYTPGWVTFNKVISILGCFVYTPIFFIFAARLLYFNLKYGGNKADEYEATKKSTAMQIISTVVLLLSGLVSIVSIEVMISRQKVDFGYQPFLAATGELAAFVTGLVCFFSVLWEIAQNRFGRSLVGTAPPPPNFWSVKSGIRMVRMKR